MVRVETVVPHVWSSVWICLAFHQGAFSTIWTILRCNLRSSFLSWPRPGRLATVPWAVNFLITLCMVDKGTLRSLEMDLSPWDCPCLATILCLTCSENALIFFLFSMLIAVHTDTKQQNDSFSLFKLVEWVIFILQAPATHQRWVHFQSKGESPAWNPILLLTTSKRCH